jgi:hypothetical protein
MSDPWALLKSFDVMNPVRDEREGQNIMAAYEAGGAEVKRLREAIHAHRVARRYNPRAAWVDARLWAETGEDA